MIDVPKTIGTVVLDGRPDVAEVGERFAAKAAATGFATVQASGDEALSTPPELIVGIGGDGTLLRAAHLAHKLDVPVIGINPVSYTHLRAHETF